MSLTINVTDATFDTEVERTSGLCLVDFWAPWCTPCVALAPSLERLAAEYAGRARIMKVNVDDSPTTADRFGIRSIPNLLFFRDGLLLDSIVGLVPRAEIAARIEQHLGCLETEVT